MPKSRIPSADSKASLKKDESFVFVGISLSGGKSDKSCLAALEYFPGHDKIFLTKIFEKIKSDEDSSSDSKLLHTISQLGPKVKYVAFDTPLTLPHCINCVPNCPGYELCDVENVRWLRNFYKSVGRDKKPKKMFTPYTQRCVDAYMAYGLDEKFEVQDALGANLAPHTARAQYLKKRIKAQLCIEVNPLISIWLLGLNFKISKSHLRTYKQSAVGGDSRRIILTSLVDQNIAFLYRQDVRTMIDNPYAFDAFICAYTAYLKFTKKTKDRPKSFPPTEGWVEIPEL